METRGQWYSHPDGSVQHVVAGGLATQPVMGGWTKIEEVEAVKLLAAMEAKKIQDREVVKETRESIAAQVAAELVSLGLSQLSADWLTGRSDARRGIDPA